MVAKEKDNKNLIIQIYYYIVMLGCVLFLGIGSYIFLSYNLTHFVFTELEEKRYDDDARYDSRYNCIYQSDWGGVAKPIYNDNSSQDAIKLSEKEREQCLQDLEDKKEEDILTEYQEAMLNSILMLLISGGIMWLHINYVRPNFDEGLTKNPKKSKK